MMLGLRTIFAGEDNARGSYDKTHDYWYGPAADFSGGFGGRLSERAALGAAAVYACVRIISETGATLPFRVFERADNGDAIPRPEHPVSQLLWEDAPNGWQTPFDYRVMMLAHLTLRGNHYSQIHGGALGPVSRLEPIHPDRVRPVRLDNGRIRYEVQRRGGGQDNLTQDEIWHLKGLACSDDGLTGLDPLSIEAKAFGLDIVARDYGGRFLGNNAQPSVVIEHPGLPAAGADPEEREAFLKRWREEHGGVRKFGVTALPVGAKIHTLSVTPEQAQFLELRKFQRNEIASIFRVPPHKIGDLERATFSNIEQQALEFITDTMLPWLTMIEQSARLRLILAPPGVHLFAKHNVAAQLRGDTLSRYRAHAIAINWGFKSANDVRRIEDENSIGPEGDTYLRPGNMMPATSPGEPAGLGGPPSQASAALAATLDADGDGPVPPAHAGAFTKPAPPKPNGAATNQGE